MPRLARVERLLGCHIDDADETSLQRLCDDDVREYQDLEFKGELYKPDRDGKKELAKDVSALANTTGGLIIIGISEDGDSAAEDLTPVEVSETEAQRMRGVIAEWITPLLDVPIRSFPASSTPGMGYFLLTVPRGPYAPHAVRSNKMFGYAVRHGTDAVWLSESDIANAYRNRFDAAKSQVDRVAEVRAEGERDVPAVGKTSWVSVALVPATPGTFALTSEVVRETQASRVSVPLDGFPHGWTVLSGPHYKTRTGFKRLVHRLGKGSSNSLTAIGALHFHTDGSGYAAARVGEELPNQATREGTGESRIPDVVLTWTLMSAIKLLVHHAVNRAGTFGDAFMEATLLSALPMHLGKTLGVLSSDSHGDDLEPGRAPVTQRMINLDECAESNVGIAVATRSVVNDLAQAFGVAELPHFDEKGAVRVNHYDKPREYRELASNLGLTVSEETV